MDWWKPIKSGGSLSCDTCPEVQELRERVDALTQALAKAQRHDLGALYNKMGEQLTKVSIDLKRWREIAEDLYTTHVPSPMESADVARHNYEQAVVDGWI